MKRNGVICRIFHRPVRYPGRSNGHWQYAYCEKCGRARWVIADLISGWLRGYKFGQDPSMELRYTASGKPYWTQTGAPVSDFEYEERQ